MKNIDSKILNKILNKLQPTQHSPCLPVPTDPQPDSSNKKRERTQINKIRNKKGEVTTDITEIQRNIRDYYKKQYVNKTDNREEMDSMMIKICQKACSSSSQTPAMYIPNS